MKILILIVLCIIGSPAISRGTDVIVEILVGNKKKSLLHTALVPDAKQSADFDRTRETIIPTEYDRVRKDPLADVLLPMTPKEWGVIHEGWSLRAKSFELDNGQISVSGVLVFRDVIAKEKVNGENTGPLYSEDGKILLSDNTSTLPVVQTTERYFQIIGDPGKKYKLEVEINGEKIPVTLVAKSRPSANN